MGGIALRPGPVGGSDLGFSDDFTAGRLSGARHQTRCASIQADRPVGQGIGLDDQRLGVRPCTIDDATEHLPGDGRTVRVARNWQLEPVRLLDARRLANAGGAGVVALPGAGEIDVALGPFDGHIGSTIAPVGYLVPHQAAGSRPIDRLGQHEGGDVAHLAVCILDMLDVVDDRVAWQAWIKFAEGAPRDLLEGQATALRGRQRAGLIDHDSGDACLGRTGQQVHAQQGDQGRTGRAPARSGRSGRSGRSCAGRARQGAGEVRLCHGPLSLLRGSVPHRRRHYAFERCAQSNPRAAGGHHAMSPGDQIAIFMRRATSLYFAVSLAIRVLIACGPMGGISRDMPASLSLTSGRLRISPISLARRVNTACGVPEGAAMP